MEVSPGVRHYFWYVTQSCFSCFCLYCAHKASPVVIVVIGLVAMCFNCCVICTPNPSRGYQCFALLYLFTCLSQGLTFLFLKSDACLDNPIFNLELDNVSVTNASCNLSWGASTGIAATVLWFVSAGMLCFVGGSKGAGDRDEEPAEAPVDDIDAAEK